VDHERQLFTDRYSWRKAVKTLAALACAALIAGAGLLWFFSNPVVMTARVQPFTPRADAPTFQRVSQEDMKRSFDGDGDAVRDGLRNAVLAAANNLKNDPCNPTLKARYIEAATQYARAWLSIDPCMATHTCGSADRPRLDRAQKAFGTALDHRVREVMQSLHNTDIFVAGDFPKDVVVLVADMAGDSIIDPYASPEGKEFSRKFRIPANCRAASLR
jgi:hypothetical protein